MSATNVVNLLVVVGLVSCGFAANFESYNPDTYPDSLRDWTLCRAPEPSLVCDPNQLLNPAADGTDGVLKLHEALQHLRTASNCSCGEMATEFISGSDPPRLGSTVGVCDSSDPHGYTLSVAILKKILVDPRSSRTIEELISVFANALRNRFSRGQCQDDAWLVFSVDDGAVWTSTGPNIAEKLTPEFITSVSRDSQEYFSRNDHTGALLYIVNQYSQNNHDVTIKTNQEAVQIFEWMNGANDVEMKEAPDGRVNTSLDWSFEAINILRNASKQKNVFNGVIPRLPFAKGYVQASFSRPAVDYMLNELDLTELIRREEKQGFGNDEIVLPTLNAADALALPGGYTHNCLERGEYTQHITRMSLWYDENKCGSKHMRHSICVFGIEDLTLWLAHLPHLFANKLLPEFDFGAIDCWYEEMFHRSYLETHNPITRLNATLYQSMPQVRFQSFRQSANGSLPVSTSQINTFDCKTGSTIE